MTLDRFYCPHCGIELLDEECKGIAFLRTVANGRVFQCPECRNEVVLSEDSANG